MEKTLSICPFCGCGCSFYLITEGKRVIGVEPSPLHPVNKGMLCIKGWNVYEFINSPHRLTSPLVRKNGKLVETGWDEALQTVSSRLKEIRDASGPGSLCFLSSAKVTNEENFLMMKLARAAFKTNNVDHCARLCHASTVAGLALTFGSGAMTNSIGEFEDADLLFITGTNTTAQHPLIGTRMINAIEKGAKLIVMDPREIPLTQFATLHLQQNVGTDVAVLNGIMNVIIEEDLYDKDFVASRTEGFDRLKSVVSRYTPRVVENISGVRAGALEEAARMYARADKAMLVYAMGITQHTTGTDNVKTCANLAMLCGNIGKPSTGVNPLRGQNNVQGACDMGALPNVYSAYQSVANEEIRKKFEDAWKVKNLDGKVGLTIIEMMMAAQKGNIKAMYIMGENPILSDPDSSHVELALSNLDFLVVQDIFLSETAALADVVLPAASFAEKTGTYTNTERRVQLSHKAVDPLGSAKADWEIICEVSRLSGYPMRYDSPAEIMSEINSLTPSYGGITYPRLEKGFGLHWPCPNENHPGTPILHKEKFTKGLGTFMPCEFQPLAEAPDEEYDFVLTTGRIYYHFHTGTMTRRISVLEREAPQALIEINPEDAKKLGIRNNDLVEVTSRRGAMTARAEVTTTVPRKVIFSTFHFAESPINVLTNPAYDPIAKIPEFKGCAVKIRRCV
ncbi:MAG: formate dehydrogenase subunit alpha [Candidatus Aminicenantales bacterium]